MKNKKSPGENYRFEGLVSLSLLLAFILVIITGVLSFFRLNNIILTVNNTIRPDKRIELAKDIYSDLIQAENKAKSYTLSRNGDDMTRFYELAEITGEKLEKLKNITGRDKSISPFVDTLNVLIEEKFNILDMVLANQDEFLVKQAMDEVMQNISIQQPSPSDTTDVQEMKEEISVTDTVSPGKTEKKESFFSRLFRKKKDKEEQAADTVVVQPITKAEPDTQARPAPVTPTVSVEELHQEVLKAQDNALALEQARRERELDLFSQDRLIMEKIRRVMNGLEEHEVQRLKTSTKAAEKDASEVKMILLSFGIASLLLMLLAGGIIFIYVRRNNEYRLILKKARDDAEELARAKERFLANMSHEIKTPMNIISGYLGQIMQTRLDPVQQEHIGIVKKSADHLLQLLNNLLDLSKLEAGRLEIVETTFSPAELINDMQHWFAQPAEKKRLQLVTDISPAIPGLVSGDAVRLRQILFNLVGNAIKFTPQGKVTIRTYPGEDAGEKKQVIFEISDTGIGIPEADLEKIFEEFEQGTGSIGQKSEGTGLGLAITKKLVGLLGGKIELESKQGKGTTFRVEIPFSVATTIAPPAEIASLPGIALLASLEVLVVDDEAYNRSLLKLVLGKFGSHVTEAQGGLEAVDLAAKQDFGIVLMDIRMPGMNGPEAAREIKRISREKGMEIPVIALSAAVTREETEKYRQEGFDEVLSKPFEEEKLVKAIIRLVQHGSVTLRYDLGPLRESCLGNEEFFREMVSMFLESTGAGLTGMEELMAKKNWQEIAELAHKISAPCKHVKAEYLYNLLKKIEKATTGSNEEGKVPDLIKQAREEFDIIRKEIAEGRELTNSN